MDYGTLIQQIFYLVNPNCKCEKANKRASSKMFNLYRKLKKYNVKRSIEESEDLDSKSSSSKEQKTS